jgi:hypothetical protein
MQTIPEFINANKGFTQLALMCENEECRIYIITEDGDIEYEGILDDYTINLFKEECSEAEYFPNEEDEDGTDVYWLGVAEYKQLTRINKIENLLS